MLCAGLISSKASFCYYFIVIQAGFKPPLPKKTKFFEATPLPHALDIAGVNSELLYTANRLIPFHPFYRQMIYL